MANNNIDLYKILYPEWDLEETIIKMSERLPRHLLSPTWRQISSKRESNIKLFPIWPEDPGPPTPRRFKEADLSWLDEPIIEGGPQPLHRILYPGWDLEEAMKSMVSKLPRHETPSEWRKIAFGSEKRDRNSTHSSNSTDLHGPIKPFSCTRRNRRELRSEFSKPHVCKPKHKREYETDVGHNNLFGGDSIMLYCSISDHYEQAKEEAIKYKCMVPKNDGELRVNSMGLGTYPSEESELVQIDSNPNLKTDLLKKDTTPNFSLPQPTGEGDFGGMATNSHATTSRLSLKVAKGIFSQSSDHRILSWPQIIEQNYGTNTSKLNFEMTNCSNEEIPITKSEEKSIPLETGLREDDDCQFVETVTMSCVHYVGQNGIANKKDTSTTYSEETLRNNEWISEITGPTDSLSKEITSNQTSEQLWGGEASYRECFTLHATSTVDASTQTEVNQITITEVLVNCVKVVCRSLEVFLLMNLLPGDLSGIAQLSIFKIKK